MRINHFVQVDIPLRDGMGRFWMDTCAGRDQVAMAVLKDGWRSYKAPMPTMISTWSEVFAPIFIDVSANTGFYTLVALASGAKFAHAFEPVTEIADTLSANLAVSELTVRATVHPYAVGETSGHETLHVPMDWQGLVETSASRNKDFSTEHSAQRRIPVIALDAVFNGDEFRSSPVILKIDVESREANVLRGAKGILSAVKPAIFAETPRGSDLVGFLDFCSELGYKHYPLSESGLVEDEEFEAPFEQRDHLFLPVEIANQWLRRLGRGGSGAFDFT